MRITKQCAQCGNDVMVHPYRAHRTPFCSRTCMGQWNALHRTGQNAANWKGGGQQIICSMCSKHFKISYARAQRQQKHIFCTRACKAKWSSLHDAGADSWHWKGAQLFVTCAVCGKEKRTESARLQCNKQHFCGRSCASIWKSQNTAGSNSPFWKGGEIGYRGPNWNAQSRAARKRDCYKCRHCGKSQKKNGQALDVHHIKPFREFGYVPEQNDRYLQANDLTNLLSLCRVCHRRAEAGRIPIQPYLL